MNQSDSRETASNPEPIDPRRALRAYAAAMVLTALAACGSPPPEAGGADDARGGRPNILLIVADDLGWSDLGAFGGEISTPNLDRLAFAGLRLTDFAVTPTCSPTRAALLTGVDSHLAGLGNMEEELGPNQRGRPGYEGYLNRRVATVARLLGDSGYRTMMAGKWHLGNSVERGPESRGFDDAFVMPGGGNHFNDNRAVYVGGDPNVVTRVQYRENGEPAALPEDYYSSAHFTDKLIEYLTQHQARGSDEPFFAFASYHAPHWPLQAPDEFVERYRGVYDDGYEPVRRRRLDRIVELGLIDGNAELTESPLWPSWAELSETVRIRETRRMQVYAGMVEALDHHVGRLIAHLEQSGALPDTVVIFLSDNGAEGNDVRHIVPGNDRWIEANFDNSVENMGRADSFVGYGPRWAEASMTPFRGFKGFVTQGGILSPAFVTYPGFARQRDVYAGHVSVVDIAPTLLELAETEFAAEGGLYPPEGKSLLPLLRGTGTELHGADHASFTELFNRRAVRMGDWKLVWQEPPFGKGGWELYNLAVDPAERDDAAAENPAIVEDLIERWNGYVESRNVIVDPELELGYTTVNEHFAH